MNTEYPNATIDYSIFFFFFFFCSSKQGFHSVINVFFRLTNVCACLFLLSSFSLSLSLSLAVFFCLSTSRLRTNHIRYHFSIFFLKKKKKKRLISEVFPSQSMDDIQSNSCTRLSSSVDIDRLHNRYSF